MSDTYDYTHQVTFDETNVVGNVYFSHYLSWQGHCRERFLFERAPAVAGRLSGDLLMVTTRCACEFYAELYGGDRVSVRMSLAGIEANRITMSFAYYRLAAAVPQLVARGGQTVACYRRTDRGPTPIPVPGELVEALEPYRGPRPDDTHSDTHSDPHPKQRV